jgi:hypothetical protein
MQFVRLGDDYVNLTAIQHVRVRRDEHGVAEWAEVYFLEGTEAARVYEGKEAAALVEALEQTQTAR